MSPLKVVDGGRERPRGLEGDSGRAGDGAPPLPQPLRLGAARAPDSAGPFVVFSREWQTPHVESFDTFDGARAHAEWRARTTPGFLYFIMSPCAAAYCPALGAEAAAVSVFDEAEEHS